ncbi:sensor histidine kinase [Pontiella sp.]|uniref:sensor histidine kinase n=1 Tax=Pontiella sp. TaxID=2837462 RepID=UPI0035632C93
MRKILILLMAILLTDGLPARASDAAETLKSASLPELKQRLASIDDELMHLADFSLRSGSGSVGYQSKKHPNPDVAERIRIELGSEVPIDEVVLVPMLRRSPKTGIQAEAFPVAFRILAGTPHTTNVVATFSEADHLQPRIAPLVVSCPPLNASWVELETTTLARRDWDQDYALHLSEILVFSGQKNVALHQPVSASTSWRYTGRHERYLVDGFVPYLMDSGQGAESQGTVLKTGNPALQPTLTIDLETPHPVNQINSHFLNQGPLIPNAFPDDHKMPNHLRVTGANRPDFSDQKVLFEYRQQSVFDVGPVLIRNFPEAECRYIRFHVLELKPSFSEPNVYDVGFSEIEVLSKGRNVALGKKVTTSGIAMAQRNLRRITDGHNSLGEILPMRTWMSQLARRHQLETERPRVIAELNRRYERQKVNLNRMYRLTGLLVAGTIIGLLLELVVRQKAILKIRKRIAANLHDELGANLHAIGLMGDTAKKIVDQKNAGDEWADLIELVGDIRNLTEETGSTARYCSNLLEADHLYQNPIEEMKRISERLLADLDHDFSVADPTLLDRLRPRRRIDLVLFYKECLTNSLRHADATAISTRLSAEKKDLLLCIRDNGNGIRGNIPPSLRRRARLLAAKLTVECPPTGGTAITLRLHTRGLRAAANTLHHSGCTPPLFAPKGIPDGK